MMEEQNQVRVDASCGHACPCAGAASQELTGIGRREFVMYGAAALAAMALAACGAAGDATGPSTVATTSVKVSDFPALANVGGVATMSISGVPVAIVRESSTSFSTFSRICPHQGSTVSVTGSGFFCPNHGATFDKTGRWIGGQRTSNLRQFNTTFDASTNTITIG